MDFDYTVVSDRVIVLDYEAPETKSPSGLLFIAFDLEKQSQAEVIAVGPGRVTKKGITIPVSVKPGDKVVYTKGAGTPLKIDGKSVLLLREGDILGTVDEWL